ncbi:MAG: phage terminase small subunit [Lachnotalea sp.]
MEMNIDKEQVKADYLSGMKQKELVDKYKIPLNTLKSWVKRYHWVDEKKGAPKKRKRGAPLNNKNAVGNSGGCAPEGNSNAIKHGIFQKYLPKGTLDIIDSMKDKSPLDLIWDAIQIQYAAIIRSQQIMYVEDKNDRTSTQIGFTEGKTSGETWEVQQAWDKQANFLKAQSRGIAELRNMVKDYLELEGQSKDDSKEQVKDWKAAIIEIAKRRSEQNGRID